MLLVLTRKRQWIIIRPVKWLIYGWIVMKTHLPEKDILGGKTTIIKNKFQHRHWSKIALSIWQFFDNKICSQVVYVE